MTVHIGQVESTIEMESSDRQNGGQHTPVVPQLQELARFVELHRRALIDELRLAAFDMDD